MTHENTTPYLARFNALARLYSAEGLEKISKSHICVVGLGGVGSWAVEALARSGVGELTLIDLDDICVRNTNRQLHALDGEFGKPKVDVMARRVKSINPECNVHPLHSFFLKSNASEILQAKFDFVLDAIDSPARKCLLIAGCRERGIPVITTGASAGRRDPTQIQHLRPILLTQTIHDHFHNAFFRSRRQQFVGLRTKPFVLQMVVRIVKWKAHDNCFLHQGNKGNEVYCS